MINYNYSPMNDDAFLVLLRLSTPSVFVCEHDEETSKEIISHVAVIVVIDRMPRDTRSDEDQRRYYQGYHNKANTISHASWMISIKRRTASAKNKTAKKKTATGAFFLCFFFLCSTRRRGQTHSGVLLDFFFSFFSDGCVSYAMQR